MMWGYGWSDMGFAWMILILGVGLIVAALLALAWWSRRPFTTPPDRGHASALDTLARRYAAGEMDEATFQRMRAQIQGQPEREPTDAQATRS